MSIIQVNAVSSLLPRNGGTITANSVILPGQTSLGPGILNNFNLAKNGLFIRKFLLLEYHISAADNNEINIIDIPAYSDLLLQWNHATPSASSAACGTLTLAVSADNGANYGTAQAISTNGGPPATGSGLLFGFVKIMNMRSVDNYAICHGTADNKQNESSTFSTMLGGSAGAFGPYNAIQISSIGAGGSGALNSGTLKLYGIL
jgi:hypothetical protein